MQITCPAEKVEILRSSPKRPNTEILVTHFPLIYIVNVVCKMLLFEIRIP
jgi:hypothetical protein